MSEQKNWMERAVPVLIIVIVVMAFVMGAMWSQLQTLTSGSKVPTAAQPAAQQPAKVTVDIEKIKALFNDKNIYFGDPNKARNLLVEIADPSCPFCHVAGGHNPELNKQMGGQFVVVADGGTYVPAVPEMKKLVDEGKAAFVYIYSPGHGNGELATKALYCAHEQGRFWPAHDKMMTSAGYTMINDVVKNDLAKSAELVKFLESSVDGQKLQQCLDSGKYNDQIAEDTSVANSVGASGTPGFFVNTSFFAGAYSWNDMKASVQ